jgi:hypothetical protein
MIMAKKKKQPTRTCADCIHESACRIWTDGRFISDAAATQCPNHETVKESGAYLCGVLDERKRKQTNADRIRAMSDEELAKFLADEIPHGDCCGCDLECATFEGDKFENSCRNAYYRWLKQPAEE